MRPPVRPVDGALVVAVFLAGAVGLAAAHVQAELAVVVVVADGLVAVGLGVDAAGHVLAAGLQDHGVALPGEVAARHAQQLGGIGGGGGLHVGVVVAAHALDAQADAGVDVVDGAVVALAQHIAAALEPVHLDHLGLPGLAALFRLRGGFGRGDGQVLLGHIAGLAVQLHAGPIAGNRRDLQDEALFQLYALGGAGGLLVHLGRGGIHLCRDGLRQRRRRGGGYQQRDGQHTHHLL